MARVDRWARGKWVHCNWNAPIQNVAIRSSIQLVLFRPLKNQQCQVYGPEVWLLLLWTWMRRASGRARGWTLLRVLELVKKNVKSLPRRRAVCQYCCHIIFKGERVPIRNSEACRILFYTVVNSRCMVPSLIMPSAHIHLCSHLPLLY